MIVLKGMQKQNHRDLDRRYPLVGEDFNKEGLFVEECVHKNEPPCHGRGRTLYSLEYGRDTVIGPALIIIGFALIYYHSNHT